MGRGPIPAPESVKMKDLLVTLNQHGLLTINSQPAVNGAPSEDKVFGWGGPNGFIYQKVRIVFCLFALPQPGIVD